MKYIECKGTPYAMGCCYGEEARDDVQITLSVARQWLAGSHLRPWSEMALAVMTKYAPDLLEEIRGLADGAKASLDEVLAINFVDTFDNATNSCTPLLVHDSPDGPVIAKNNDTGIMEQCRFVTLCRCPDRGIPTLGVTYAGWLSGLDVMNAEGLANTHGSVGSRFDKSGQRLDIRLAMMEGMGRCRTSRELLDYLHTIPLTGKGFSIAIGDRTGETCFLDAAVPNLVVRSRNEPFAFSTNLYRAPEVADMDQRTAEAKKIALWRTAYIEGLPHQPENLADIRNLLKDHSSPWAPCCHGGESAALTRWSMICLPQKHEMLVADGNPCQVPFVARTI